MIVLDFVLDFHPNTLTACIENIYLCLKNKDFGVERSLQEGPSRLRLTAVVRVVKEIAS